MGNLNLRRAGIEDMALYANITYIHQIWGIFAYCSESSGYGFPEWGFPIVPNDVHLGI
jgi:acyl-CoA synthetase (NDP forming)